MNQYFEVLANMVKELYGAWRYVWEEKTFTPIRLSYEDYWLHRGEHTVQPRHMIMAKLMESGSSVLDVGCGDGTALKYWSDQKGIKGVGCDLASVAVESARSKGVTANVADITAPNYVIDTCYDYIVVSEVLEHLADPESLLLKLHGAFRKAIFVTVPNSGYYRYRLRLLFGRFPVQWTLHPAEHLRFWTVLDFKRWAAVMGYTVSAVYPSNGFPGLYRRLWPNLLGHQMVYVLTQSEHQNTQST